MEIGKGGNRYTHWFIQGKDKVLTLHASWSSSSETNVGSWVHGLGRGKEINMGLSP